jgi:glucose/arabinose dehydrogenase
MQAVKCYTNIMKIFILAVSIMLLLTSCTKQQTLQSLPPATNSPTPQTTVQNTANKDPQILAQNLDTPWAIAFLPDNSLLVTERPGRVQLIKDNQKIQVANLSQVKEVGEGGLLGIATHPKFSENKFVYLYYTYNASGNNTKNRVVRMKYNSGSLEEETIILDNIPGASNHDGGRIKFGPDNYLYVTTGDAQEPSEAQNTKSLAGKILKVTDEGQAEVYSYGHRNSQGLAWDDQGRLWSTEHGPSGLGSCCDELNLIQKGNNYGWPTIQGDKTQPGMLTPKLHSGNNNTWAPSGIAFLNNKLYFSGLRGQALYSTNVQSQNVSNLKELYKNQYGRIREVIVGPDKSLYITTSNQDGRGSPKSGDDKIIKLNL